MEAKQRGVNINFTAIFWLARSAFFSYNESLLDLNILVLNLKL